MKKCLKGRWNITLDMIRRNEKLTYLKWWDVVVLSIILFGKATLDSLMLYFSLDNTNVAEMVEFTTDQNWAALIGQGTLLLLAFLYLWLRRFDFSRWPMKITPKAIGLGVVIFAGVSLIFDVYFMVAYAMFPPAGEVILETVSQDIAPMHPFVAAISNIDLSLLIYSLMNGFYEEIFFLGICLSVEPKHRKAIFIYSLLVRYVFHTYQGNISALAIGFLLGPIFYFLYTRMKKKNLVPFFIAHSFGDLIGVGLLSLF